MKAYDTKMDLVNFACLAVKNIRKIKLGSVCLIKFKDSLTKYPKTSKFQKLYFMQSCFSGPLSWKKCF